MNELIWMAIPAIVIAGLVHGTFSIGFPLVATPLLALFTDVLTAVLITLLPTMAVNLSIIWRNGIEQLRNIRPYLMIVPFALIGTLLGSWLLLRIDARPFLLVLALAILLYLNQDRLLRLDFGWVHSHKKIAFALFGLTAGLMGGTVNVMLPVLIVLFLELRMASAPMAVLFNINFFTGKLTQSFFFLDQLSGSGEFLLSTLWLVPAAVFSLYLGTYLSRHITESRYQWVLRTLLWIMSAILVARYFSY